MHQYKLKVLKDLAIFRHFYHLSRKEALKLPSWEWKDLLKQYQIISAENKLNNFYCSAFGFNGGEGSKKYIESLENIINEDFSKLAEKNDTEDNLDQFDKFLSSFGI